MKRIFFNEKKSLEQLDSLFIYTVLATMLGARLGHVFFTTGPTIQTIFLKYYCQFGKALEEVSSDLSTDMNLPVLRG